MKIAVLMPAYNAAAYIGDALASLLRQRDAATLDIVVVDDGSTDDTVAIVEQLAAPEVRLLRTPHGGVAAARNAALAALAPDTDIVAWLDADDLSPPGRMVAAVEIFSGGDVDMLIGMTRIFHATDADPLTPVFDAESATFRSAQLGGVMLSAALTRRVGAFDLEMQQGEDGDYIVRALELQPRYRLSDEIVVYYRRHGHNLTLDSAGLRRGLVLVAMKAARRRRAGAPAVPQGIFQSTEMWGRKQW
jgi:glycosyltransferase involved in cell wall biosynthesis